MSVQPVSEAAVVDPHRLEAAEVVAALDVAPERGLTSDEALARHERWGRNELAETPRDPAWKRFAAQFRDRLIQILLGAAVVSYAASGELKTPIVVLVVVLLNAVIGFVQENRAEAALDVLRDLLVTTTRVRRDGTVVELSATDLVPGDVVSIEAGDRIPADGRLLAAVNLDVDEASLTGESVPVAKTTDSIDRDGVGIADRRNMAYMNSMVTRGRGEVIVTTIGMETEIGRVAGLLRNTVIERSPLQHQLDGLARSLARLAGLIVTLVFAIGWVRGQELSDLFLTAVALAVASIPEGLPAVTAVTLAIGVSKMARRNAIVKHLAGVETLGCTSVICTDKTGTLTLNQMTAQEIVVGDRCHDITGGGYSPVGTVEPTEAGEEFAGEDAILALALCADATLQQDESGSWGVIGDPTDGGLVVLAAKAGLDVATVRAEYPRGGEVPFDSVHRFMATAHPMLPVDDAQSVRVYAKGALDALLDRCTTVRDPDGAEVPVAQARAALEAHNARLAGRGLRVLAVAQRDVPQGIWAAAVANDDLMSVVDGLALLAIVGIADPPRPEAAVAVAEAESAGISVKMITGDHAATAAAIGQAIGLGRDGRPLASLTGAELATMSDSELDDRIGETTVFARVAPEHKLRLVAALQRRGEVVAMTGDGVNDAPALKQADIGVAMGVAGTEVAKEAATMVLTDDNFATIVAAIEHGRTIYDNIVSFVRFQLSTTLGFAGLFLASAVLGIAGGQPFTAIAILWVNVIMDGPPAMALGLDVGDDDIMERSPRPRSERILTPDRWFTVGFAAVVMAIGTLTVLAFAPGPEPVAGTATVAGTMAFNTFVLFQFFNILNVRSDRLTVFRSYTFGNRALWIALAGVLTLQIAATHVGFMQALFDTTSLDLGQWVVCLAVASTVLWIEEARKLVVRLRTPPRPAASATPVVALR